MLNIDFLPERICRQRALRKRIVRQGWLLAGCALALVVLGYVRQDRIATAKAEQQMLNDRAMNVQQQLRVRDALEKQQAELVVMQQIEQDLGSRINVLDVLSELERVTPPTVSLTHLAMETMDVRVPKQQSLRRRRELENGRDASVRRIRLTVTGLSPTDVDVANFIGQLSASPLFDDVNMDYARNREFRGRQAREFRAMCYVAR
jgi:Tfp pilus assembly protein PilN